MWIRTWTIGENGDRVVNAFETWCWRRMLKIKWTDRITNDEVFQRVKEERLVLKILQNKCHSWIGHIISHNEFVVNILEGAICGKRAIGRPQPEYLKQVARNTAADSKRAMKRMACNNCRWKDCRMMMMVIIIIVIMRRMLCLVSYKNIIYVLCFLHLMLILLSEALR